MKNITKKILALFLALSTMVTLIVPAFSAGVNVDGQGGSSATINGGGRETYNNADQLWKISIYYSRYDTNTTATKNLGTTSHWVQYGKTFYMYNPTANRGASGKINMNFIKNSVFVSGNKVNHLKTSSSVSGSSASLTLYNQNYFYDNTKSPAIAMNGYTNDAVKEFFGTDSNVIALAQQAYKAAGYDSWSSAFGNTTFSIDGFNGSYVDKTANSGKAQNGYTWNTATKHLTFNDWYKGIKTDYKGKQIYLHPKTSDGAFLSATAWVIVYEPVLCVEPKTTLTINGTTYKYVCCTPTEFAILQQHGVINIGTLASSVFGHLSNSTVLDKKWFTYTVPSGKFSATSSTMTTTLLNNIYNQAGWGMTMASPYNYVIKDYKAQVSAPKSVKAGEAFKITYTHSNLSVENKGNTGSHEAPINVQYVWVAMIEKGGTQYWFDLFNLSKKTLSTSTALKNSDGTLVKNYTQASAIVEQRRADFVAKGDSPKPFNKGKHYYRGKKDDSGTALNVSTHSFEYTIASEFSGCSLDIRACTNTDSSGSYGNAKKEISSGAYYKSGEIKK